MSSVAPLLARNWRAKSIHNCIIYLHERILTLCLISAYLGNPGFLLQKNSFSAHDIHSTKSHTNCYKIFQQRSHLRACLYPPHTCVWWENLRSLSTNCEYRLKTSSGQRAEWMGVRGWCCKDKNVADLTRSAPETTTVHWKRALCRYNFLACYRFDCRGLPALRRLFIEKSLNHQCDLCNSRKPGFHPFSLIIIFAKEFAQQQVVLYTSKVCLVSKCPARKKMVPIQGLWRVKLKFRIILEVGEAGLTMTISTFLTSSLVAELC